MKNLLIAFITINCNILVVSAQHDSLNQTDSAVKNKTDNVEKKCCESRLPQQSEIGFTFNFIGFLDTISIGSFKDHIGNDAILMRYYLKDDLALRLGAGFNLNNQKISRVDSVGSAQVDSSATYHRTDIYFSPGVEKHFISGKNIDPYIASTITAGKIGRTKIREIITTTDTTGKSKNDVTIDFEGGYVIGLNFITGFNYFFSEKFSIGAEYGLGINSSRYGGDWTEVTIITPSSGSQSVKREVGSMSVSSTKIKMNSNVGIMLSYFF